MRIIPYIDDLAAYITTIIFSNNTYNNSIDISDYRLRQELYNVTKVTFSPFAKTIGGFKSFAGLKDIVIPRTVEEISSAAFFKSGIETVTFQGISSLKKIGESAFRSCPNLRGTIDIPGNTISIGELAFVDSPKISKIIIRGELECLDRFFPSTRSVDNSQLK